MSDHDKLKCTFNSAARFYHQARPDYPEALYDALTSLAQLSPGDRLLEIGCATGKATIPLARRGFRITAVELGPELAAEARHNLAGFPAAEVVTAPFEAWRPAAAAFDLVFAATAWHWIDPAVKYQRAFELLRPGGHLAYWMATHVFPAGGDSFFRDIQPIYEEIGAARPDDANTPAPGRLPEDTAEILATGLFDQIQVRHFDWETSHSANGYIQLLDSFSSHIVMDPWKRDRLYSEIRRRLAERPDGRLRRHWGSVLHVARRRANPAARQTDQASGPLGTGGR